MSDNEVDSDSDSENSKENIAVDDYSTFKKTVQFTEKPSTNKLSSKNRSTKKHKKTASSVSKEVGDAKVYKDVTWHRALLSDFEKIMMPRSAGAAKWCQAKTVVDGNCGLDALCIAMDSYTQLSLARHVKTWMIYRHKIAENELYPPIEPGLIQRLPDLNERERVLQPFAYIDFSQIAYLCLDICRCIPIILTGKDPAEVVRAQKTETNRIGRLSASISVSNDLSQDDDVKTAQLTTRSTRRNVQQRRKRLPGEGDGLFGAFAISDSMPFFVEKLRRNENWMPVYVIFRHIGGNHWIVLGRKGLGGKHITKFFETYDDDQDKVIPKALLDNFNEELLRVKRNLLLV